MTDSIEIKNLNESSIAICGTFTETTVLPEDLNYNSVSFDRVTFHSYKAIIPEHWHNVESIEFKSCIFKGYDEELWDNWFKDKSLFFNLCLPPYLPYELYSLTLEDSNTLVCSVGKVRYLEIADSIEFEPDIFNHSDIDMLKVGRRSDLDMFIPCVRVLETIDRDIAYDYAYKFTQVITSGTCESTDDETEYTTVSSGTDDLFEEIETPFTKRQRITNQQ
jgi:hypothetical protein